MYNFLDPKLLPKVATVTCSLEGYEPSNLISENPLTKSRGFLAYSCIKPPIDIDFELICPICIHYITVSCKLGTQRIVGVEVQAKNDGPEFTTIAHGYFNEDNAVFCNVRYHTRTNPPKTAASVYLGFLKGHLFRIFTNAKFIRIRILRTERSTPCLGPVEIWGRVAKSCPKITAETVVKLMTKRPNIVEDVQPVNLNSQVCDFEISDDFKDALTFEIMAIPMTLPSGHSVDQSTMEKCARNDASYGRQCCDPFTGLPFTDNRKPKLNVALKNRIDMFLLQNAHRKETFGISRTVGKGNSMDGKKFKRNLDDCVATNKSLKDHRVECDVLSITKEIKGASTADYYNINNKITLLDDYPKPTALHSSDYNNRNSNQSASKDNSGDKDSRNQTKVNIASKSSVHYTRSASKNILGGLFKDKKLLCSAPNFLNYKTLNNKSASKLECTASNTLDYYSKNNKFDKVKDLSCMTKNNTASKSINIDSKDNTESGLKSNKLEYIDINSSSHNKRMKFNCVPSGSSNNCDNSNLDDAIAKVINSSDFVTFTKDQFDGDEEVDVGKCCVCGDCNNLYGLPCFHLYCRTCLLDVCKTLVCNDCGNGFCRNDVAKIHG